jgi:hypothetical protein
MPSAARRALGLAAISSGGPGISLAHSRQEPDLDTGLEYPGTPAQTAGNVSMLWRADLDDQGVLERGLINPAAWNDASLRWLVDPASSPGASADSLGGVRIGMADVERFRATAELFAQLDDRFGGGHARQSLIQYLRSDGERLLRAPGHADDGDRPLCVLFLTIGLVVARPGTGPVTFLEPVPAFAGDSFQHVQEGGHAGRVQCGVLLCCLLGFPRWSGVLGLLGLTRVSVPHPDGDRVAGCEPEPQSTGQLGAFRGATRGVPSEVSVV